MSSKSVKGLKGCSPHPRPAIVLSQKSSPQHGAESVLGKAGKADGLNAGGNRSFQKDELSPDPGANKQCRQVGRLIRRSMSREWKENLGEDVPPANPSLSDLSKPPKLHLHAPSLHCIELQLNERLIKGSQNSDKKAKFEACREALIDLTQANPECFSLMTKITNGVDEWVANLQSSLCRKRQEVAIMEKERMSEDKLERENEELREKVGGLTLQNAKLTRQLSELRDKSVFPGPHSDLSGLISSLQEELSIHRRREDLLMSIINSMREKGYPVSEFSSQSQTPLDRLPTSDSLTISLVKMSLLDSTIDRGNETEITYSVTPCNFDAEDSADIDEEVPHLGLPAACNVSLKGGKARR